MEKKEGLRQRLSALATEDKLFIAAIFLIGIFVFWLVSTFKHIPSPVFGGDFYMARGFTQAILQGTPFWQDPYFSGNYAYYGWLSYLTTAFFVKLTGIGLERMSLILAGVLQVFYLLACYLFGSALFKSKKYGLLFVLAAFSVKFIDMKLSAAMAYTFMLLSLYSFIKLEQGSKNHRFWLGIFLGLTALSHINIFICLVLLLSFTLLVELVIKMRERKLEYIKAALGFAKRYYLSFIIGFALAMMLIGPWIFIYHMQTLNPAQQYSLQDISKIGLGWVLKMLLDFFVRLSGTGISLVLNLVWGIVLVFGLIFVVMNKRLQEPRAALLWLVAMVLATSHFLITRPLLNNWIVPGHLWGGISWMVELVLFIYGIKNLELMLTKMGASKKVLLAILLIFLSAFFLKGYSAYKDDRWVSYGRTMDSGTQVLFGIEEWVLENTPKDAVFLANDESSFALNALTGRRLVIARRTHCSYYVDVEKRYADALVMLYGNNLTKTAELLKTYNVTHLYLDSFLYQYPMIANLKYEQYLRENGVNYTIQEVRLDPSTQFAPSYLSIVVPPQEISLLNYNITMPVQQFNVEQQPYSLILEIINT